MSCRALSRTTWVAVVGLFACAGKKSIDADQAAVLFDRVTVDTGGVHGLSGLAVDGDGALWTVAERGGAAFRIVLDGARVAGVTRHPIDGLPPGEDLEAVAILADGALVVGTEGRSAGVARVFKLRRDGERLRISGESIAIGRDDVGIEIGANHGAEAACAVGTQIAVALETAGSDAAGRWAPLVMIDLATDRRVAHRVRLRTATGKLSGLDCWRDGDRVRAVAIERHFQTTQLVGFDLPRDGAEITTTLVVDLAPVLRGALNLEGIVRLPDGRLVAVVDNQYGKLTGPDELLVFKDPGLAGTLWPRPPPAPRSPPAP